MSERITKKPEHYEDPDIKLWFYKLDQGLKRRKEEEELWRRNEDFADLKSWEGKGGPGDDIMVNKVHAWLNSRVASLVYHNPYAKLTPQRREDWRAVQVPVMNPETGPETQPGPGGMPVPVTRPVAAHKVTEALLNRVAGHQSFGLRLNLRRFTKAVLLAYGALKVGYEANFHDPGDEPEDMVPIDPDTGMPDYSDFETYPDGQPVLDDEGNLIRRDGGIISEKWFVEWANHWQMIIDPDGGNDFRKHRWVAYEYEMPLVKVKADRRFKNTEDLKATGTRREEDADTPPLKVTEENTDPYIRDNTDMVRLFEIWDMEKDRMLVLADGHGEWLMNERTPKAVDKNPYVICRFDERICEDGDFYCTPEASYLVPLNDEYNKYRKQLMSQMRKSARKYIMRKGVFNTQEREKLTSPEDSVIAEMDRDMALGEAIGPLPIPNVSADVFAYGRNLSLDFDEVAGEPGEARGVASSKTATQANKMDQYRTVRIDDQRALIGLALEEMYKKLLDSIQANMTKEMAVTLTGSDGNVFQAMVSRDMILGDYDVSVDVAEMTPKNDVLEQAQFIQALQVAGQSMDLIADPVTAEAIFGRFGIKDQHIIEGFVRVAQTRQKMEMMLAMSKAQPRANSSETPSSDAQAISQRGGGAQ